MESFALSPEIASKAIGMYWALGQVISLPGLSGRVKMSDAVAVAGVQSASGNRRRTVLVALAGAWDDQSRYGVASVRDYLESINVPLAPGAPVEPVVASN